MGRAIVARLSGALRGWRGELAFVFALTVVTAVPRLVLLDSIPSGLHGDEGWTGLDAQRVLNEGWIGPYVKSALGQPTGPLYFAAPFVDVFGDSIFAVRFPMALLAIATVPLAYLTFRLMFDRTLASFAALLLALSLWHLHYSRIGFMVISWPLVELLALSFLFLALRSGQPIAWALAGLALGAGVYTYNAYPVFPMAVGLFLVALALGKWGDDLIAHTGGVAFMAAFALLAALPLLLYVVDSGDDYFAHHRVVSLFETPDWESGAFADRAGLLADSARDFAVAVFWNGAPDATDGAGRVAMVDRLSLVLIAAGVVMFLRRWREPGRLFALIALVVIPLGAVVTGSVRGTYRQSFGLVPFLALLAAEPLAEVWRRAGDWRPSRRAMGRAGALALVAAVGFLSLRFYFGEWEDTRIARFTFAPELTAASLYLRDLDGDPFVYFYSERWAFRYETRRYLAAEREGEDRSREFGTFSLARDASRDVVFVFLPSYLEQADAVRRRYPGGTPVESRDEGGRVQFRAYELPREGD